MKKLFFISLCVALSFTAAAQQSITLSDLWQRYSFYAGGISGLRSMNDGAHYSATTQKTIDKYSYESGEKVATLFDIASVEGLNGFDGYSFNADETAALLETETVGIFTDTALVVWFGWPILIQVPLKNSATRRCAMQPTHQMASTWHTS